MGLDKRQGFKLLFHEIPGHKHSDAMKVMQLKERTHQRKCNKACLGVKFATVCGQCR